MTLSREQYKTVVDLLTPYFNDSPEFRKATLTIPLYGSPVLTKVNWSMSGAAVFTAHLVDELARFDESASLCAVLRHIATITGEPTVSRIGDLIRELERAAPVSGPSVPPPAAAPAPTDALHAFISYSRKDTAFVERLEAALRNRGTVTWRDATSIPGGDDWYQNIVSGLAHAYAVICIVTANAEESKWVRREQLRADEDGIPAIAVHPAKYRNPLHLQEVQPILMDDAHFEAGMTALVAKLAATRGDAKPAVPHAPRPDDAIQEYLKWVLTDAKADLRDALYVDLAATPEHASKRGEKSAMASGLDEDEGFVFSSVALEHLRHDDFAKAGDDVPDARRAICEMRRTVLLGDPGAGKTTTLLKLTVDLARAAQADHDAKLPLYVPLREFDGSVPFEAFVRAKAHNLQADFDRLRDRFVLLCDALNEMPRQSADERDLVAEVRETLRDRPDWVVSCRVRDYTDDLRELDGIGKIRLKPLDLPRIREFITRKFASKGQPERGAALWRDLHGSDDLLKAWDAFATANAADGFWEREWIPKKPEWRSDEGNAWDAMRADHRRLMLLCRSPFMANMVCALYAKSAALPDNRAGLFGDFVANLLQAEAKRHADIGLKWIGDASVRAGLARIAWTMGAQTEMPRADAEQIIREHIPGHEPAAILSAAAAAQLIDSGTAIHFTHQLLQQYFAASVLGAMMNDEADPAAIWPPDAWWESTGREETAILLAGDRNDPHAVARWLAPAQPHLALELLSQPDFALDLSILERETRSVLTAGANAKRGTEEPRGRAAAFRVLGKLNTDERPGIGLNAHGLPDIEWRKIPAGEFIYQKDQKLTLPGFEIARYPITYAQFQCFVDAADFDDERWWAGMPDEEKAYSTRYRTREIDEQAFKFGNHPRENVSWYQAVAYCRWLGDKLGYVVDLPMQEQWERAARGREGRNYPYDNVFDALKGNTAETGIGQTSAVGMFLQGASPDGVEEMSGNVWEWCLNKYRTPMVTAVDGSGDPRVVRGGSWGSILVNARAAFRFYFDPNDRNDIIGFRLVRPPSL